MPKRRVNPNRMELLKLKTQLTTARRGHKLLKDKRDELMRQFMDLVKNNADLRLKMEGLLKAANQEMVLARALMGSDVVESALSVASGNLEVRVGEENTMSVRTPVFSLRGDRTLKKGQLPYAMTSVSAELDEAVDRLAEVFPVLIELATAEKKAERMALEIERTRRRVNSLEYVLIPELIESIREITMKMDEQERGNLTRLMKVKDLIVEQALEKKKARATSV